VVPREAASLAPIGSEAVHGEEAPPPGGLKGIQIGGEVAHGEEAPSPGGLKGILNRGMAAESLTPINGAAAHALKKWNTVLPKIKKEEEEGGGRAVRGKILLESSGREQEFLFLPDSLIMGEKREKLTAVKLFELLGLPIPQLLFYVSNGDVTQTWHFRKPLGFDFEIGGGAPPGALSEEQTTEKKLSHWRNVVKQKLLKVLANTAKSCLESGAYFCVDASGFDAIGSYLQAGCTKRNVLLAFARGGFDEDVPFGWHDDIIQQLRSGVGQEEADKEIGGMLRLAAPVELNDAWMDGDRLRWSSVELKQRCEDLGVDPDAYKFHPSAAPTHFFVTESAAGKKVLEEILQTSLASGEFIINGSFIGTARRAIKAISDSRPCFIFQHSGGCADLMTVLLNQVKAVEGQFAHQQRELAKSKEKARLSAGMGDLAGGLGGGKKEKAVEPPRLVDLFVTQLPFDPFKCDDNEYVFEMSSNPWRPKIEMTGVVGNKERQAQRNLMHALNAFFANWPPNLNPEARLVIDPFVQRGDELQDLITRTMCATADGNNGELNGAFADEKRLRLAWEMHSSLFAAADSKELLAVYLQLTILVLGFATTALSAVHHNPAFWLPFLPITLPVEGAGERRLSESLGNVGGLLALGDAVGDLGSGVVPDGGGGIDSIQSLLSGGQGTFVPEEAIGSCTEAPDTTLCQLTYYLQIILPLVMASLLSFKSRFDPDAQVVELRSGASVLEEHIYKFRTRTGPYSRAALAAASSSDDGEGGGKVVSARDVFGKAMTDVWKALTNSLVSEHSMPKRMNNIDHTKRIHALYFSARPMMGRYMPGEHTGPGGPEDEAEEKNDKEKKSKGGGGILARRKAAAAAKLAAMQAELEEGMEGMDDADEVVAAAAGAGGGTGGGDEEDEAARVDVETLDDGIQGMSAEDYVRMRMLPYLILYSNRSPRQARQLAAFETIAIGLSAATSLLGALNMTTPVPLFIQFGSVLAAWQAYKQMRIALKMTNGAVSSLEQLVLWWQSLSMIEKRRPDSKEKLVRTTEEIIASTDPSLALKRQMAASDDDSKGGEGDKGGGGD